MSKKVLAVIASVAVAVAAALGIILVVNGYNSGKIGNKAEKIEKEFQAELVGEWKGSYSISKLNFAEDGTLKLTLLGIDLDGTYEDNYDIETDTHTLTVKYNSSVGVSVTRTFTATVNENGELTMIDKQVNSIGFVYRRSDSASEGAGQTADTVNRIQDVDELKAALIGQWNLADTQHTGYDFIDSSTVAVKLMGVSYNGSYSVSVEEETGMCLLKITYVRLAGTSVSNTYYAGITDGKLTLVQKGAESISQTYTKA